MPEISCLENNGGLLSFNLCNFFSSFFFSSCQVLKQPQPHYILYHFFSTCHWVLYSAFFLVLSLQMVPSSSIFVFLFPAPLVNCNISLLLQETVSRSYNCRFSSRAVCFSSAPSFFQLLCSVYISIVFATISIVLFLPPNIFSPFMLGTRALIIVCTCYFTFYEQRVMYNRTEQRNITTSSELDRSCSLPSLNYMSSPRPSRPSSTPPSSTVPTK